MKRKGPSGMADMEILSNRAHKYARNEKWTITPKSLEGKGGSHTSCNAPRVQNENVG
jgi:hypothetical protein